MKTYVALIFETLELKSPGEEGEGVGTVDSS